MADPNVFVDIEARDKTKAGISSAQNNFQKLGNIGGAALKPLAIGVAALTAVTVGLAAGVTLLTHRYAEQAKQIDLIARGTGNTTKSVAGLSVAFQRLGKDGDDVRDVLTEINIKVADAAAGSDELREAWRELGFELEDLQGRASADIFIDMADGLAELEPRMQNYIGDMIFGGDLWQQVAPLMNEGSDAIREQIAEWESLGVTLTDTGIQMGVVFENNVSRMQFAVDGIRNQLVEQLLPTMNILSDVGASAFEAIAFSMKHPREGVNFLDRVFNNFWKRLDANSRTEVAEFTTRFITAYNRLGFGVTKFARHFEEAIKKAINNVIPVINTMGQSLTNAFNTMDKLKKGPGTAVWTDIATIPITTNIPDFKPLGLPAPVRAALPEDSPLLSEFDTEFVAGQAEGRDFRAAQAKRERARLNRERGYTTGITQEYIARIRQLAAERRKRGSVAAAFSESLPASRLRMLDPLGIRLLHPSAQAGWRTDPTFGTRVYTAASAYSTPYTDLRGYYGEGTRRGYRTGFSGGYQGIPYINFREMVWARYFARTPSDQPLDTTGGPTGTGGSDFFERLATGGGAGGAGGGRSPQSMALDNRLKWARRVDNPYERASLLRGLGEEYAAAGDLEKRRDLYWEADQIVAREQERQSRQSSSRAGSGSTPSVTRTARPSGVSRARYGAGAYYGGAPAFTVGGSGMVFIFNGPWYGGASPEAWKEMVIDAVEEAQADGALVPLGA